LFCVGSRSSKDLKAFSDDQFEPVEWINSVLKADSQTTEDEKEEKDAKNASEIVSRLQIFIQEINRSLEESAQNVLLSMAKVQREVQSIDDRADKMRRQLREVRRQVDQVQSSNSSPAVDRLTCLDRLRNRMMNESERLKEADNWHSLNADFEQAIAIGQIQQVYEKLLAMQSNLHESQSNDYSDRHDRLHQLKRQFETLLASNVSGRLLSSDKDTQIAHYVSMYRELALQDALIVLFQQCLTDDLQQEWQKLKSTDLSSNVLNILNRWFEHIFTICEQQSTGALMHLYPESDTSKERTITVLIGALSEAFKTVESDITQVLSRQIESESRCCDKLQTLVSIRAAFDRFVDSLESILGHKSIEVLLHRVRPVFLSPYRKLLIHLDQIDQILLNEANVEIIEHFQLTEFVGRCFSAVNGSINRCRQTSHLLLLPKTLPNVLEFVCKSLRHLNVCLTKICDQSAARQPTANWSLLQLSLLYLQTVGDFSLQINAFGRQLMDSLTELETNLRNPSSVVSLNLCILNEIDRDELKWLLDQKSDTKSLLKEVPDLCKQICCDSSTTVFAVASAFVSLQLDGISKNFSRPTSSGTDQDDIPLFSLSPQEYITQIGQYLLTVPQHIEPFTLQENAGLRYAFQQAHQSALTDNVAEHLIRTLVKNVNDLYVQQVSGLTLKGKRDRLQLATDMSYLCEIVTDLGIEQDERLVLLVNKFKTEN
jgi:hypothetical protein